MFIAHMHLFLNHHLSFLLFFLSDMGLAGIAELGEGVLSHVVEHAAHHLGFMEVEGSPLSP